MERGPHLVCVVHAHSTAPGWEIVHLPFFALAAISRGEDHLEFARLVHDKVCCPVLWERAKT